MTPSTHSRSYPPEGLGLKRGEVVVIEYDPRWSGLFDQTATELVSALARRSSRSIMLVVLQYLVCVRSRYSMCSYPLEISPQELIWSRSLGHWITSFVLRRRFRIATTSAVRPVEAFGPITYHWPSQGLDTTA